MKLFIPMLNMGYDGTYPVGNPPTAHTTYTAAFEEAEAAAQGTIDDAEVLEVDFNG